jgi:hypothetical protein
MSGANPSSPPEHHIVKTQLVVRRSTLRAG